MTIQNGEENFEDMDRPALHKRQIEDGLLTEEESDRKIAEANFTDKFGESWKDEE